MLTDRDLHFTSHLAYLTDFQFTSCQIDQNEKMIGKKSQATGIVSADA
jgi:hypothetical protein